MLVVALPVIGQTPEIILKADSAEGVTSVGAVRVGPPTGKPEDVALTGMAGEPVMQLGKWSKPNPGELKAVFAPDVPTAGHYDVYARWYTGGFAGGVTDSLPITIKDSDGQQTLRFSQRLGNVWAYLGTHHFKAGREGQIVIDATGSFGASNINAIKLVPVAAPPAKQKPKTLPVGTGVTDDFDKLRLRLADVMTPAVDTDLANPIVAEKIAQEDATTYFYWKTMKKGEGEKELWTDVPVGRDIAKNEGGGWPLVAQYRRLADMAAAYVSSSAPLGYGAKMQGNPELLADILYGLEFFYQNRFNERTANKLGADWIANEMNQPQAILQIILLTHPAVPEASIKTHLATIERMNSDPRSMYGGGGVSTGFNRLGFVYVHALRAIVERNPDRMKMAIDAIWDQLDKNDRGKPLLHRGKPISDGFYDDGSFIQHKALPYMPIYGTNVLNIYADLRQLLQGSPWELKDPRDEVLSEWIYKGVEPLFYRGDVFYRSTGRSIGQSWIQNNGAAYRMMEAVAKMVPSADAEDKKAFEGMIKTWMAEDHFKNAYRWNNFKLGLPAILEIERIMNDPKIAPRPRPLGPKVFHNSDYVVYHAPGYAASLSMSSTRIETHEMMQGVNNRGWYQGDGTLFVHTPDPTRYNEDFWPTVNPYRLPGITVDPQPRKDGDTGAGQQGKASTSPWAGGVQLGAYAMASMGLAAQESSLTAQKSWLFAPDQIVCLGSAINSEEDRSIETIVENAKLNAAGDNALVINGTAQPATLGWSQDVRSVQWAFVKGSFPEADIGWVFPTPADLKATREERKGKWLDLFVRDVQKEEKTRNYLTLWLDHGKRLKNAGYAYIVLPGMTQQAVEAYAGKLPVRVVSNSQETHAVELPSMGVRGATFWSAGTAAGITSSSKAAVLVVQKDGTTSVAIADPTQLEKSVELTIETTASTVVKSDERIKVTGTKPLKISVDLENTFGRSLVIELK